MRGWHGGRRRAGARRHRADPRLAPRAGAGQAASARPVVGIAHQAIYDSSRPAYYDTADVMFGVSRHVVATLRANGVDQRPRRAAVRHRRNQSPAQRSRAGARAAVRVGRAQALREASRRCAAGIPGRRHRGRPTRSGRDSRWASFRASPAPSSFPRCSTSSRRSSPRSRTSTSRSSASRSAMKQLRELRDAVSPLGTARPLLGTPARCRAGLSRHRLPADRIAGPRGAWPERHRIVPVRHAGARGRRAAVHGNHARRHHRLPVHRSAPGRGRHFAQLLAGIADGTRKPDIAQAPAHLRSASRFETASRDRRRRRPCTTASAGRQRPRGALE